MNKILSQNILELTDTQLLNMLEEVKREGGADFVSDERCPLTNSLKIIGGKWKIPIIFIVNLNPNIRYNELRRKITGITNTMLASSLKELEKDNIIKRVQYDEVPLRVEYSLKEGNEELIALLIRMASFGTKRL